MLSATETVTATATLLAGSTFTDTSAFATPAAVSEISNFIVTTTAATGAGSLEQAILAANADTTYATPYTITFAITPGSAPYTINLPSSGLTPIARPVVLDATSQTGYAGSPIIVLDGTGVSGSGLVLGTGSDGSLIRGFDIIDFTAAGTEGIDIASGGNAVQASYVGVQAGGSTAAANASGILIAGSNNTIGGTAARLQATSSPATRATASRSPASVATGNVVAGNLIGTDVTGEIALGNTDDGIYLAHTTGNTIGGPTAASRNIIAADGLRGIEFDSANSNLVENNYIGTDVTGSTAMGVGHNGIYDEGTSNTFVGNVIDSSGNIGLCDPGEFDAGSRQPDRLERRGHGRTGKRGGGHRDRRLAATRSAVRRRPRAT